MLSSVLSKLPVPLLVIQRAAEGPARLVLASDAGLRAFDLTSAAFGSALPAYLADVLGPAIERGVRGQTTFDASASASWPASAPTSGELFEVAPETFGLVFTATRASEGETFWNALLEHMPQLVIVKDAAELRIRAMSRAWDSLGLTRGMLLGKSDYDFFPKEEADQFRDKDEKVLASMAPVDVPAEPISTPKGNRRLSTRKISVRDAQGRATHMMLVSNDITEQLAQEEELRERMALTDAQRLEIERLSAPVLKVARGVLAVTIAGSLDRRRGSEVAERALRRVAASDAHTFIIDITGIEVVDTSTSEQLGGLVKSVALMGLRTIVCGMQPAVAQAMVALGITGDGLTFARNLREAIERSRDDG